VGTVAGIDFSGNPDANGRNGSGADGAARAAGAAGSAETDGALQWARVRFSHGVRTVPAGSMRFVDFSKPDPAEERVERFMLAAQRAMAEGEYELAAQRLVYARDAEPRNVGVLRLMTLAFWQAGNLEAAARSVRDWARVDPSRPAPHRFAARIYEDIGAIDLAEEAADRAAQRGPADAGAWERLGRLRLRLMDREGALRALERALALGAGEDVRDLVAQALAIEPSVARAG
jgi:tetratricopeptide (TPR) repeat protein